MAEKRNPIIYKGEKYHKPVVKKGGPSKDPKISYDEARQKIISDIDNTSKEFNLMSQAYRMPNEIIMCLRMNPDFSAKSYYPSALFNEQYTEGEFQEIGSRIWRFKSDEMDEEKIGKLLFVRTSKEGLQRFKNRLSKPTGETKQFEVDVRKLDQLNLLSKDEQIIGFDEDWQEGVVEVIIHPFNKDKSLAVENFLAIATQVGVNSNSIEYKQYEDGITFISLFASREAVNSLSGYNPLRAVHPLVVRDLPDVSRSAPLKGLPQAPKFTKIPEMVVGILDGGFIKGNSYLDKYVEVVDNLSDPPIENGPAHGTLVTSAALYGPLNAYSNTDKLPEPIISVRNFRVLSKSVVSNINLYGAITEMEKIVPNNPDISVYGLSFGPKGGISDDDKISRFTYACDRLSKKYGVLFCVAVGNDGEEIGYDRIQAPSDIVNGLGVGAFTILNNEKIHAPYSCKGPGREGNKLKPDVVAFAGCERFPIQLIAPKEGYRIYTYGTSFATPLVAATETQIIGASNKTINTLVARALLIHATKESGVDTHCNLMGHGAIPDDIVNIVTCKNKSYTLIYEDEIPAGKYVEYTIPWVEGLVTKGKVNFRWTTAVLTNVDPLSTDDYTTSSIQTTFYPNTRKFKFENKKTKQTKSVDIDEDPELVRQLLDEGWKKGEFPVSKVGPQPYETEGELRTDLKWDSIDYRKKNITAIDVKQPMFHIHSIQRGTRNIGGKVKFALILSLLTPSATVDIYPKIIAKYHNLLPLKINVQNRIKIAI